LTYLGQHTAGAKGDAGGMSVIKGENADGLDCFGNGNARDEVASVKRIIGDGGDRVGPTAVIHRLGDDELATQIRISRQAGVEICVPLKGYRNGIVAGDVVAQLT
jgi:hypothetical protein